MATTACSTSAPPLPLQDRPERTFSSEDVNLSCDEIAREWESLSRERQALSSRIGENRTRNQAAVYVGFAVFPPALILTEGNDTEKLRMVEIQSRRDTLIDLARTKACASLH